MLKNITLVLTTHSTATFKLHHITLYTPRQQMYHFEKEKNAQIHLIAFSLSLSFLNLSHPRTVLFSWKNLQTFIHCFVNFFAIMPINSRVPQLLPNRFLSPSALDEGRTLTIMACWILIRCCYYCWRSGLTQSFVNVLLSYPSQPHHRRNADHSAPSRPSG